MIRIGSICIIDSESEATESTVPSGTVVYLADGSRSWILDDAWFESETFAETAKTKRLPIEVKSVSFKAHREVQTTLTASTFTDIGFDLKIDEECNGITFLNEGEVDEDTSIIVIDGINDIISIGGCVHTNWTGAAGTSVTVASRVLYSTDEGVTWTEARCLQSLDKNARGVNAEGTFPYAGSIRVYNTTWVKLQVHVSSASMLLEGDPLFDNPVAATIHMKNNMNNQDVV